LQRIIDKKSFLRIIRINFIKLGFAMSVTFEVQVLGQVGWRQGAGVVGFPYKILKIAKEI